MFHGLATAVPLVILKGEPWWPAGFARRPETTFEGYPHTPNTRHLREFYMFQLGYYLHAYVATFKQTSRPNFVEMIVHHVVTIVLVVSSYFVLNVQRFGVLVFWTHDVCDVFVCLTRILLELDCIVATAASYIALMSTWVFYRLYVFSCVLAPQIFYVGPKRGWFRINEFPGWPFMCVMLAVLIVMHFIWFKELLAMAGTYFKTGTAADSTDENKEDLREKTKQKKS